MVDGSKREAAGEKECSCCCCWIGEDRPAGRRTESASGLEGSTGVRFLGWLVLMRGDYHRVLFA